MADTAYPASSGASPDDVAGDHGFPAHPSAAARTAGAEDPPNSPAVGELDYSW